MRIAELRTMVVRLPLRKAFKHASLVRKVSENFVVRCRLQDGTIGWGEGIPRSYVTGETPDSAMAQAQASNLARSFGLDCQDWHDVIAMCDAYAPDLQGRDDPRGCLANTHRCAIELSVLDAFGKRFDAPVRELAALLPETAGIRAKHARVQYSSAISTGTPLKERRSALAMRLYGFSQCKVKVGMTPDDDPVRLRRMRRWVGSRMDLRVDANEAWSPDQAAGRIEALLPAKISCVEQPVHHDQVGCLAEIRQQVPVPLMLDESLTGRFDAERAIAEGLCDVFNIRISKCGGLLRSWRLAGLAQQAGLAFQLGCHPGESSILSAAGRHFLTSVAGARYREGSADGHLLKHQIADPPLTFGYGGWAPALVGPGLGVHVVESELRPFILRESTYPIR